MSSLHPDDRAFYCAKRRRKSVAMSWFRHRPAKDPDLFWL